MPSVSAEWPSLGEEGWGKDASAQHWEAENAQGEWSSWEANYEWNSGNDPRWNGTEKFTHEEYGYESHCTPASWTYAAVQDGDLSELAETDQYGSVWADSQDIETSTQDVDQNLPEVSHCQGQGGQPVPQELLKEVHCALDSCQDQGGSAMGEEGVREEDMSPGQPTSHQNQWQEQCEVDPIWRDETEWWETGDESGQLPTYESVGDDASTQQLMGEQSAHEMVGEAEWWASSDQAFELPGEERWETYPTWEALDESEGWATGDGCSTKLTTTKTSNITYAPVTKEGARNFFQNVNWDTEVNVSTCQASSSTGSEARPELMKPRDVVAWQLEQQLGNKPTSTDPKAISHKALLGMNLWEHLIFTRWFKDPLEYKKKIPATVSDGLWWELKELYKLSHTGGSPTGPSAETALFHLRDAYAKWCFG